MRSVPSLLLCVQVSMSNAMATKLLLRALRYSRIPVACLTICLAACVARGKLCASVFVVGMQQLASQRPGFTVSCTLGKSEEGHVQHWE